MDQSRLEFKGKEMTASMHGLHQGQHATILFSLTFLAKEKEAHDHSMRTLSQAQDTLFGRGSNSNK